MTTVDYSALDDIGISMNAFYPRKNWSQAPPGAVDFAIEVGGDISLSSRFFPAAKSAPAILFFYGNGETVNDYNNIAPLYIQAGSQLFRVRLPGLRAERRLAVVHNYACRLAQGAGLCVQDFGGR